MIFFLCTRLGKYVHESLSDILPYFRSPLGVRFSSLPFLCLSCYSFMWSLLQAVPQFSYRRSFSRCRYTFLVSVWLGGLRLCLCHHLGALCHLFQFYMRYNMYTIKDIYLKCIMNFTWTYAHETTTQMKTEKIPSIPVDSFVFHVYSANSIGCIPQP